MHDWLLAFLVVFVYATHATQAIAFEWKPGLKDATATAVNDAPTLPSQSLVHTARLGQPGCKGRRLLRHGTSGFELKCVQTGRVVEALFRILISAQCECARVRSVGVPSGLSGAGGGPRRRRYLA